jgi:hypothetical protein
MRVIVNIHSRNIIKLSGWRAKAVQINNYSESNLKEVLDNVIIVKDKTLYNILIEKSTINENYILFVNGSLMPDTPDFKLTIRDNVQIHIMDRQNNG